MAEPLPKAKTGHPIGWSTGGFALTFIAAVSYFLVAANFADLRDVPWINAPLVLLGVFASVRGIKAVFAHPDEIWKRTVVTGTSLLSVAIGLLFFTYIGYLSYQMPQPTAQTENLEALPEFALQDQNNATFKPSDYLGKNLLIIFYRGYW